MATLLWLIAVILIVAGVWRLLQRDIILGIILIIVGLLIGPGGVHLVPAVITLV